MHRRRLLKSSAALFVLHAAPTFARERRRVRPGEPGWPTPAQWEELRWRVGGNLLRPRALCRTCKDIIRELRNPYYLGDQPSGTQVSGWLNAWSPAPSAYAVAAHSAADVVAAVNFARDRKLRVVIKGGGHSYQGTSNAADSLLIWTRPMQAIVMHEEMRTVTVEAGALWTDVYDAVTTRGRRYVQGGGCATVGVAGLIQSGGFGSFSKRYGTAAGSLLEAQIVTADGVLRTVNSSSDPELFWALKGGGGGSLGVVTQLTLQTHELPDVFGAVSAAIKASSDGAFRRLLRRFVDFYANQLFNPHWGESVSIGADNTLKISMVSQGLDLEAMNPLWRPLLNWITASPQDFAFAEAYDAGSIQARGWWDMAARRRRGSTSVVFDDRPGAPPTHAWWSGDQEQVGAFLYGYESLWLPASLLGDSQRQVLSDALFDSSRSMGVALHFNKGLAGAPAEAIAAARATAMNPAALDAFALAIIATGGPPPGFGVSFDAAGAQQMARDIDAAATRLRLIAPQAGSYVSESNFFNRRWQEAFWGSNYARLRAAKAKYDPDGLFFVHHGAGSEEWSEDGFVRL
jgi:FAD/FMN-containing dehydrogenase